jgi:hypothetical protein
MAILACLHWGTKSLLYCSMAFWVLVKLGTHSKVSQWIESCLRHLQWWALLVSPKESQPMLHSVTVVNYVNLINSPG